MRSGFEQLVRLAYGRNAKWQAALQEQGATVGRILRDCTRGSSNAPLRFADRSRAIEDEDTVRPPWRHGELGRNDLAAYDMYGEAAIHQSR
jgi:hypothetical protein